MTDISAPALEKAIAKVKQLVPNAAGKLETMVCSTNTSTQLACIIDRK
jgi:hypothetical protein